MLTGKYPVDGDTLQEIGQAAQEPINWTIYPWNFLSDGLRDLIQQMLKVRLQHMCSACDMTSGGQAATSFTCSHLKRPGRHTPSNCKTKGANY
jgi:hypothetical protein